PTVVASSSRSQAATRLLQLATVPPLPMFVSAGGASMLPTTGAVTPDLVLLHVPGKAHLARLSLQPLTLASLISGRSSMPHYDRLQLPLALYADDSLGEEVETSDDEPPTLIPRDFGEDGSHLTARQRALKQKRAEQASMSNDDEDEDEDQSSEDEG